MVVCHACVAMYVLGRVQYQVNGGWLYGWLLTCLKDSPALGRSTCVESELLGCGINKLR